MKGYVLLDAGGTQIKSAAFTGQGTRLDVIHSAPSCAQADRKAILENLLGIISRESRTLAANGCFSGSVGMAFPGPFDYKNGISRMKGLSKYDAIEGLSLEDALKNYPGQDVLKPETRFFFRHDVDSFALGAASMIPSCADGRTLCLCIGTGAGSAFLEEGRLLKRDRRIPDNGWIYLFPFRGAAVDDWISARGLEKLAMEAGFPPGTSGKELSGLAARGDRRAEDVWKTFGIYIAEALQPFMESFRPHRLVLGGQISKAEPLFGKEVRACFPTLQVLTAADTTECIFRGLLASDGES